MNKKTKNALMIGGIAVLAYYFFKKPSVTSAKTTARALPSTQPTTSTAATIQSFSSLLNSVTGLLKSSAPSTQYGQGTGILTPSQQAAVQQSADITNAFDNVSPSYTPDYNFGNDYNTTGDISTQSYDTSNLNA